MKIVYGVHGYGRGHAMRALAVLPELVERHEVLILAGGDAYRALAHDYAVQSVPTFQFHYTRRGKLSNYLTFRRNLSAALDLWLQGPASDMVVDFLADFRPDVVVSDSEAFTHHAARRLRIPRISFDHFGLLVYCRPEMSRLNRLKGWGDTWVYRRLFGSPERVIVSSFFPAPPRRADVYVVGPVIRPEVRQVAPSEGEHLLVYLCRAEHEFSRQIEEALQNCGCPCRIYGTSRRGLQGNLQFKPIANLPFIEDLASCRAVFATTGNQLLGEVLYFRKPILGMPHACLEQQLNAEQIERRGIGMQVKRRKVTGDLIRRFLAHTEQYKKSFGDTPADGAHTALEALERFAGELTGLGPRSFSGAVQEADPHPAVQSRNGPDAGQP